MPFCPLDQSGINVFGGESGLCPLPDFVTVHVDEMGVIVASGKQDETVVSLFGAVTGDAGRHHAGDGFCCVGDGHEGSAQGHRAHSAGGEPEWERSHITYPVIWNHGLPEELAN